MIDLEQRLTDAFAARADAVRPEQLAPNPRHVPTGRPRRVLAGALAVAAAVTAFAVLTTGGGADRANDPGPADGPTVPGVAGQVTQQELVPLAGPTASYDDGASGTLVDDRFEVTAGGTTSSAGVRDLDRPRLTTTTVDLGDVTGYVLVEGGGVDPSFSVFVPGPERRLVLVRWSLPTTRIELPAAEHDPGYVGWLTWVGTDGRLYDTAYRGKRVPEEHYRWVLRGGTGAITPGSDEVELTPRHLPAGTAAD